MYFCYAENEFGKSLYSKLLPALSRKYRANADTPGL